MTRLLLNDEYTSSFMLSILHEFQKEVVQKKENWERLHPRQNNEFAKRQEWLQSINKKSRRK